MSTATLHTENMKQRPIGFDFNPANTEHHFFIIMPQIAGANGEVSVCERIHWKSDAGCNILPDDILKIKIPYYKWEKVADVVAKEFNARLKAEKKFPGKFAKRGTPVERLLGKELMVLLWAIENVGVASISTALRNWLGLQPEERWWLYTITNASTGGLNDSNRGWRVALRYALCENPVNDYGILA